MVATAQKSTKRILSIRRAKESSETKSSIDVSARSKGRSNRRICLKDLSDREKYRTTNTSAAVIGILVLAAIASAQSASVLTIDDAVALALKGNRDVQAAALEVDRAREGTAAL